MPEKERLSPTETRAYDSFQRMTSMTTFGGGTIAYNYDSLGRTQAATAGTDGWGNRLTQSAVKSAVPTMVTITDPATNRIQSPTYDANGNTVNTPQQGAMTYGVMNRLKTVASDTYGYDPSNKRIWKNDEYTFYGAGGERIGRYSATKLVDDTGTHVFVFQKVQVDEYFGGRRLTTQDRLGSVGSYYPYGEAKSGTVSNADSFATYYRDSTGLDYADQRYYVAGLGRFTTPDLYRASTQGANDPNDPSSWNRYTYVGSDPTNRVDPPGTSWYDPVSLMQDPFGSFGWGGFGGSPCQVFGWGPGAFCALQIDPSPAYTPVPNPSEVNSLLPVGGKEARTALGKESCYKMLGLKSAEAAQSAFEKIKFNFQSYGRLTVQAGGPAPGSPAPANTHGAGQININTDYNWSDFSRVTTSTGATYNYLAFINQAIGKNMTSTQLATMIIIHEIRHQYDQNEESGKALLEVFNACIK